MTDLNSDQYEEIYLERPWNQLSRFKVTQIINSSVLQVQDVTDKMTYIMKGIEKPSSNIHAQSIYLPQNVPYMVELIGYFQSEDKLFLLLKKAKGGKLFDYIRTYTPTVHDHPTSINEIFTNIENINTTQIQEDNFNANSIEIEKKSSHIIYDSDFLVASIKKDDQFHTEEYLNENSLYNVDDKSKHIPEFNILPAEDMDVNDLVNCSQKLLLSVSRTLNKSKSSENDKNEQRDFRISDAIDIKIDNSHHNTDALIDATNIADEVICITNENIEKSPKLLSPSVKMKMLSLPEASIKQWARELLVAIESLHDKGIILGDLHSDNLLLGSKGQLLLSYFYQNEGGNCIDNNMFSNFWIYDTFCIAPERPLTFKSDWWSFGVVLFELVTGYSYKTCHPGGLYAYFEVQYPIDIEISNDAKNLLDGLLQNEPEYRFNLDDIKSHQFFDGTLWKDVIESGVNSM